MNPQQQIPKNLPLVEAVGQMGFRLCLLGLVGFLGWLVVQRWLGVEAAASSSMTFQLLISCWGFAAAGGLLYVYSQFVVIPFRRKNRSKSDGVKETAYQLALLGGRYRVFNGIDLVLPNGVVQAYPHVVVGPNGVFYLAPVDAVVAAHGIVLQEVLWGRNIRNVELVGITLPTPRLAQTIGQQKAKRRLTQSEVAKVAAVIEGCSRPTVERVEKDASGLLMWMVPVAVFALVVTWVVVGNGARL